PGAAGKCAEFALFLCCQLLSLADRWTTYPVGNLRRKYPGNKKRSSYSQCTRFGDKDQSGKCSSEENGRQCPAKGGLGRTAIAVASRCLRGGRPLEHEPVCHKGACQ